MSTTLHFQDLPPELLRLILTSFDSFQDLYRLLQASPQCFRIYQISPESILSSLLKRRIQPDALCHALAVVGIGSLDGIDPENERQLWQFLDYYFKRDPAQSKFPEDMKGIIALIKLSNMISGLVNDYTCRTLQALYANEETHQGIHQLASAPCSHHSACRKGLSATEQARVQRAFFRYELYSRCSPVNPRIPMSSIFPADDQYRHFLQQMAPWEIEELTCLHEYFWVRASSVWNDVEEDVVVTILDAQTVTASTDRTSHFKRSFANHLQRPNTDEDGMCRFNRLHRRGLEFFSEDEREALPDILRYLISLGLPYLRSLLTAQGQRRRDLIRRNCFGERVFLPHAIYEDPNPGQLLKSTETISDDKICHANLGYLLFRPTSVEAVLSAMGVARYWPLRRLGYVFWDIERIRDPEINKRLGDAGDCEPAEGRKEFNRYIQASPEVRLKGIKLHDSLMQEIQDDFSYMLNSGGYGVDFDSESGTGESGEDHE